MPISFPVILIPLKTLECVKVAFTITEEFPNCAMLARQLGKIISLDGSKIQLAFVRSGNYMSDKETSGFHADGHIDGRPIKDPSMKDDEGIMRFLINLIKKIPGGLDRFLTINSQFQTKFSDKLIQRSFKIARHLSCIVPCGAVSNFICFD